MEKFVENFKLNLGIGLGVYFLGVLAASFFGDGAFRWVSGVFLIFAIGYIIFTIVRLWKLKKTDSAFNNKASSIYAGIVSIAGFFLSLVAFLFLFDLVVPDKNSGFSCDVISFPPQVADSFWIKTISFLQSLQSSSLLSIFFTIVFAAAFLFSLVTLIIFIFLKKGKENPIRRLAEIFLTVILVLGLLFGFIIASWNNARVKSLEARRVADMKQMQLALELYFDGQRNITEGGIMHYPIVSGGSSQERWENLGKLLVPDFIASLPVDPCVGRGFLEHGYDYKNSPDGKTFVIKAILSQPENPALMNDLDGEVLGLWCGEQGQEIEYCENNE